MGEAGVRESDGREAVTQTIPFPASTEWGERYQTECLDLIRSGRKTLIVLPVEPQPVYEMIRPVVDEEGVVHAYCDPDPTGMKCPYPVGSELAVTCPFSFKFYPELSQKTWSIPSGMFFTTHGERSDVREATCPASAMEDWMQQAFRLPRLTVKSVECRRVNSITEDEAQLAGILDGGCLNCGHSSYPNPCGCHNPSPDYRDTFLANWFRMHGEKYPFETAWAWMLTVELNS